MTNLKSIKTRIQSIENTKKITRAMKMVAAAKVKRAENMVKASRPFTENLNVIFSKLVNAIDEVAQGEATFKNAVENYPCLLKERDVNEIGILVITSNKGLAGGYNSNIIKKTVKMIKEYSSQGIMSRLFIVGQKGISALKKRCASLNCEIVGEYLDAATNPSAMNALVITEDIAKYFVEEKIDKIQIITTRFKNMMSYRVEDWTVLPVQKPQEVHHIDPLMEFSPSKEFMLRTVVPMYITNIIYHALLEAQASELASRMTAMSAATSNAENILRELSIQYNKTRQMNITNEIIEVISGANVQM